VGSARTVTNTENAQGSIRVPKNGIPMALSSILPITESRLVIKLTWLLIGKVLAHANGREAEGADNEGYDTKIDLGDGR
jgi:hypothetical protein